MSNKTQSEDIINSLKKDKYLLYSVLNSLKGNLVILNDDGTIVYTNKAWDDFARENGIHPEKVSKGVNYLEVCKQGEKDDAPFAEEARKGIIEVMSGKRDEFTLDYPCHSPDELRWFKMRVTPFVGTGPFSVVIVHEEITERKLIELEKQTLLDNLPIIIMRHQKNEGISFVNQAVYRHLNIFPKMLMRNPDRCGIDNETVIMWRDKINQVFQTGESVEFETKGKIKGDIKYFQCKIVPEYVDDKVKSALSIVYDITEKEEIKQELKREKAYYQQLFENSPDAVVLLNNEEEIIRVNHAFEEIFEYEQSEVQGKNINDIIVPEGYQKESLNLSDQVYRGEEVNKETVRKTNSGKQIEVGVTGFPVFLETEEYLGIYVIYRKLNKTT